MHGNEDLTGIAIIVVVAALMGLGMIKLRQPAIVGYILTGILSGPNALGLVSDRESINLLAELGVILLLYFIGMELSLRSFSLIWKAAVLIVLAQITLGLLVVSVPAIWFDWPITWMLLAGFCLAMSSTAVAFNILSDVGALKSRPGRMAIGILIAQDLAIAPMLLILDGLKNTNQTINTTSMDTFDLVQGIAIELTLTIFLLCIVIYYLSKRKKVDLFWLHTIEKRGDILPLITLASCFGIASLAGLVGLSPAFGAFMAGLIVGNSLQQDPMRHSAEPIQVTLLMVFFLSVGLLVDLNFVFEHWFLILSIWLFVLVFKTASNILLVRLSGLSWSDSLTVALVIGQMGEFSFVLATTAFGNGLIDSDIHRLIIAITVLSLMTSPIYVQWVRRNRHRALRHIDDLSGILRIVFFSERKIGRNISRKIQNIYRSLYHYYKTNILKKR